MISLPHQFFYFIILGLAGTLFLGSAQADPQQISTATEDTASKGNSSRLACQPCAINFGKVAIGKSKVLPVVLKNGGKAKITISAKEKEPAWISPSLKLPYTLKPGGEVKFHLVYTPLDGRKLSGHLAYKSSAGNHLVAIALRGESTSGGTLAATPSFLNFGSVAVGNASTLNQTIKNVGTASVTISQVTEAGSGFSMGAVTTPLTLAPGHSVTVSVHFDPQKAATYSGSLVVLSSATNYRMAVTESGTGTASSGSLSISPSSVSFGNVAVGSSVTKSLTLTANGTGTTINSDALSNAEYSISGISLPMKLAAGKSVTFKATFSPQTSGQANGTLALTSSNATARASLTGTGTGGSKHSVSLSWNPDSSSVSGYNVYRGAKSGGPFSKLTSSVDTATDYLDTNVAAGGTYYYEVTAVSEQGKESRPTAPVKATVP
jgi:Abnormal spindle-like microcephaly-assoc'd, ASPM-SPD-2-Hydin